MVRQRFIYCGIAAAFILAGAAEAQERTRLRGSLDALDTFETLDQTADPANPARPADPNAVVVPPPTAAPPTRLEAAPEVRTTTLEVRPPEETPPQPRRRRRAEDPYEALGISAGGLTLFPVMRAGVIVSDNPASLPSDRKGDVGARLRPSLRITSDWIRHELTLEGSGDFIRYADLDENDTNTADIRSSLRLDVRRSTTLTLDAAYSLTQENGSDAEVPDSAIGNRTDQSFSQNIALTHRGGLVTGTVTAGTDWRYFGDVDLAGGGKEENSDREYVEPEVSVRLGYEASPAFRPFVEAAYAPRIHFESRDRNGLDRDSDGYRLTAGVAFEPSPIWSGELALTYLIRDFADPDLKVLDAFGLTGQVAWRPSELTTVSLNVGTALNETSSADSSGSRVHSAQLGVRHRLRENLEFNTSLGVDYEAYQGSDETELTLRSTSGVLWRMNRWLAWTLDYDFIYNDSSLPDSDDYENRVTAGIEVRR